MLSILCGEESGTKCHEHQDPLSIVDIHNRYLSPASQLRSVLFGLYPYETGPWPRSGYYPSVGDVAGASTAAQAWAMFDGSFICQ